jgi:N-acetylglutamate synthase-like GNAT family acetyltransferase
MTRREKGIREDIRTREMYVLYVLYVKTRAWYASYGWKESEKYVLAREQWLKAKSEERGTRLVRFSVQRRHFLAAYAGSMMESCIATRLRA